MTGADATGTGGWWALAALTGSLLGYALAALPTRPATDPAGRPERARLPWPLLVGWLLHLVVLVLDIGDWGQTGTRLGFAPVLSLTVWLVVAVHTVESRLVPLPPVRISLALAGMGAVLLAATFPGEARKFSTSLGPLHFVLGVASYGLFGAAVLHGLLLDAAERRLKQPMARQRARSGTGGLPLLQLERLTFRFVEVGFIVLSATLLLGTLAPQPWRWDHKTVFSVLAWGLFAALVAGRRLRGWRGRSATRWLYAGAVLLLLAYVGSRFVFEVLLERPWR